MREFLSGLFEVSLTMGAVTALLLILSPVWKRRFRPQWYQYHAENGYD